MLTPQEAASTWCPMVRIARREETVRETEYPDGRHVVIAGCNTDALGRNRVPNSCTCIADKCAMWRWELRRAPFHYPVKPTHGYCGLAGAPTSLLP